MNLKQTAHYYLGAAFFLKTSTMTTGYKSYNTCNHTALLTIAEEVLVDTCF